MYAKIFSQIFDGTLCTNGPWEALVTFQQMLILADKEGIVDMTPQAISRRTTIPVEIIERGLEALMREDPHSRSPAENGRRIVLLCDNRNWGWRITNYKIYAAIRTQEDRREYHREYWHKRKAGKTQQDSTHSTKSTESTDTDTDTDTVSFTTVKDKRASRFDARKYLVDLGVEEQVVKDWIAHRSAKNAKPTQTAINGIVSEAKKAGVSLQSALEMMCQRGWTGFKADWVLNNVRTVNEKQRRDDAFSRAMGMGG